jgi:hypothetical protein
MTPPPPICLGSGAGYYVDVGGDEGVWGTDTTVRGYM